MANIIINADDFGLTHGVSEAIVQLLDSGAISSTTLMVAAPGAISRIRSYDRSQLAGRSGVHLQLTGGSPLSDPLEVPTLVNADGTFADPRNGGSPDPEHVEIEWTRQIEIATELLGAAPTHLDTHHGMHRRPDLMGVYVALAKLLGVAARGATGETGRRLRKLGAPTTTSIVRDWSGSSTDEFELARQIEKQLSDLPEQNVIEVVTHPGYVDDDLRSVSSLAEPRASDRAGLVALRRIGWIQGEGHTLTSFPAEYAAGSLVG